MAKISQLAASSDFDLGDSLSVIRQTHVRLHVLMDMTTTATVLASRIELCDALLLAISGVRSSLAKDLQRSREPPPTLN